jgi:hypothetical protein
MKKRQLSRREREALKTSESITVSRDFFCASVAQLVSLRLDLGI